MKKRIPQMVIFPAKHYLIAKDVSKIAVKSIRSELKNHLSKFFNELEKQRLEMRTNYDLEMIEELGYCSGIENPILYDIILWQKGYWTIKHFV